MTADQADAVSDGLRIFAVRGHDDYTGAISAVYRSGHREQWRGTADLQDARHCWHRLGAILNTDSATHVVEHALEDLTFGQVLLRTVIADNFGLGQFFGKLGDALREVDANSDPEG